jgi:WD40 repeat protein
MRLEEGLYSFCVPGVKTTRAIERGGYMPLRVSLVHQFEQQQRETWDVHFAWDGRRLVSSDGSDLYLWQLNEDGTWSYEHSLPFRNAARPRFAPDGKMLAFGGKEPFVKLISLDGRELATFPSPNHADWAFSPDQRWLVSSDKGRDILLWDLASYQSSPLPIPFPAFDREGNQADLSNESVGRFLFTPDGQQLVFGASSAEGYIHICLFEPAQRRVLRQTTFSIAGMIDGAISPDGTMLAMIVPNEQVFAYKQDIYIYDLDLLQLLHVFPQTTAERYCQLAFSSDSHYLVSCKSDGLADIFALKSLKQIASFAAHPGLSSHATDPIGGLDWSKTGYIATGGASEFEDNMNKADYTIKIWKVEEK